MNAQLSRPSRFKFLNRRGSATLELGLTLLLLLWVTFGTIEFGQYFYIKNQLQGAAREGARAGVPQGAVSTDITNAVANVMTLAGLPSSKYTVTQSGVSGATGSLVTVTVKCTWSQINSGFSVFSFIGGSKQVTGSAIMRKE
jgi:Flp pilus assembly protein TadG